jgi:magnesium chelatase family protein
VLGLSGRGHDRVLRVARTVADLAGAGPIGEEQMAVALGMRHPV